MIEPNEPYPIDRVRRRFLLALLVLVAFLLSGSCGGVASGADRNSAAGTDTIVYRNSDFGLSLARPPGFPARAFHLDYGMVSFRGAVVTNAIAGHRAIAPYSRNLSKLPARSVVFLLEHRDGGPGPALEIPEAHFPLRAAAFGSIRGVTLPNAASWRQYGFSANGWGLLADVYFGPRASRSDRAAIWHIVSSLRFKSLRTGQRTGDAPFLVLKKAESYPVGAVERMSANAFLVRAPRGFYGIGGLAYALPSKFPCRIRFERAKFEFVCANGSRRWDRMGRPLWKGASWRDNLGVLVAVKVGQDGHVLFCSCEAGFGSPSLERKYWGNSTR
jgi:hypothetical protein